MSTSRLLSMVFVTAVVIEGCSVTEVDREDLAAVVERDAMVYAPPTLPGDAVDLFASNQVVLIGETHWIFEHREFVSDLVRQLHPRGVRQVLLEFPQAGEWLLDDYMDGGVIEPDWIPPMGLNGDLIEAIRAFNRTLPRSERIRVRGIDVMLEDYGGSDGFNDLMESITHHLGDPGLLTGFMAEHHGTTTQMRNALDRVSGQFRTRRSELREAWGDYWYNCLSEMVEVELSSMTIREWRADRYDESVKLREDVMKELTDRRLLDFPYKTLINVGGNHAQKSYMLGTNQEWLGDYLVHKSTAVGGPVIVVSVRPARIISHDETEMVWDVSSSSPANELWRVMRESAPNSAVLLPLNDRMFSEETVLMNYEDVIYDASPKEVYDVLVSLPVAHRVPH